MQSSFDRVTVVASIETRGADASPNHSHTRSLTLKHAVCTALAAATLCAPWMTNHAQEAAEKPAEAAASGDDVTKLSDMQVTEDPLRAFSSEPSASSFGFAKPLLET